jgi:dTDP-4-dehydrorhamnose 3,5-epimerase
MIFKPLGIQGAWVVESVVWPDERGFFLEWFKKEELFAATGFNFSVQQANFSLSHQGVIRGIHYSLSPKGQAKWVTCVSGSIIDVLVDLRTDSPTFKSVEYVELNHGDGKAVFIAPGLGHGFRSLMDNSGVAYLVDSPYAPEYELAICPTDSELGIEWGEETKNSAGNLVSPRDLLAPTLEIQFENGRLPKLRA